MRQLCPLAYMISGWKPRNAKPVRRPSNYVLRERTNGKKPRLTTKQRKDI